MTRHRQTRPRALLLLAFTLWTGCGLQARAPKPEALALPSVADVDAALSTRRQALHSLRALARLRYTDRDGSRTARQALIVERPANLRLEILSLVGPVFLLATNGDSLTAFEPSEAKLYRGRATPANLLRYAHVPVPIGELVDLILATPEIPATATIEVSQDDTMAAARVDAVSPLSELRLWWAPPHGLLAAERRDTDGEVLWHATYSEFAIISNISLAAAIALDLPLTGQRLELNLRDTDVNPTLDPGVFALQTPANATVVDLDAEPM